MATHPPRLERRRLVDILVAAGLLDRADAPRALALVKQTGNHLLRVVVDEGWVEEDRLVRALSSALGYEAVTPATMKIHERVLALIAPRLALRYHALPVAVKRSGQTDYLYVALADPLDLEAIDDLSRASNCRVNVLIAPPTQLDAAIHRFYGEPSGERRPRTSASAPPGPSQTALKTPQPMAARGAVGLPDARGIDPRGATMLSGPPAGLTPPALPGMPPPAQQTSSSTLRPNKEVLQPRPTRANATLPPASPSTVGSGLRAPGMPAPSGMPAPAASGQATTVRGLQAPVLPGFPGPGEDGWNRTPSFAPPSGLKPPSAPDGARGYPEDAAKTQLDTDLLELGELVRADQPRALPTLVRGDPARISDAPRTAHASISNVVPAVPRFDPMATLRAEPLPKENVKHEPDDTAWDVEIDDESDGGAQNGSGLPLVRGVPDQAVELSDVNESLEMVRRSEQASVRVDSGLGLDAGVHDEVTGSSKARDITPSDGLGRSAVPPKPGSSRPDGAGEKNSVYARTMEVPVSLDDVPSPFDGMRDVSVRAGLELTGIIPALDWETEAFEPEPARGKPSPHMAGIDDIPSSAQAVRARQNPVEDAAAAAPREAAEPESLVTLAPDEGRPSVLPELDPMMIEEVVPARTEPPRHEPEEPITNPRMAVLTPAPAPVTMPLDDARPVERAVGPYEVTPAHVERLPSFDPAPTPVVIDPAHKKLVDALMAGDSLNSAERAQLLLALARVLVQKGIVRAEDLARALASDG